MRTSSARSQPATERVAGLGRAWEQNLPLRGSMPVLGVEPSLHSLPQKETPMSWTKEEVRVIERAIGAPPSELLRAVQAAEAAGFQVPKDLRGMGVAQLERLPGISRVRAQYLAAALSRTAPKVVVTRHAALVQLLVERSIIPGDRGDGCCSVCGRPRHAEMLGYHAGPLCSCPEPRVLAHASEGDVRGAHVIGVLPLRLAALADRVTEIPLAVAPEDRGRELDIVRLREIAGDPVTYRVTVVPLTPGR